ncbi:hypothetical protein JCM8097_008372 [Rhodosporidiobolus ruineniae]
MEYLTDASRALLDLSYTAPEPSAAREGFISSREDKDNKSLKLASEGTADVAGQLLGLKKTTHGLMSVRAFSPLLQRCGLTSSSSLETAEDEFASFDLFASPTSFAAPNAPASSHKLDRQATPAFSPPPSSEVQSPYAALSAALSAEPHTARSRNRWEPAEDAAMIKLWLKHGRKWSLIASELQKAGFPKRHSSSVKSRYDTLCAQIKKAEEAAAKGEPLPPAPWSAEEDAALLRLDTTVRAPSSSPSSSSPGQPVTPSIEWEVAKSHFPGRSADELKKRCSLLKQKEQKEQKVEAERRKKEENERATRQALQQFQSNQSKLWSVALAQSTSAALASSSGQSSSTISSSAPTNPLLLKLKLPSSTLPSVPRTEPKPTPARMTNADLFSPTAGPVFPFRPPSSSYPSSSGRPINSQISSRRLAASTSQPQPHHKSPRYEPYPFLWTEGKVRRKMRGLAAALRTDSDEEREAQREVRVEGAAKGGA